MPAALSGPGGLHCRRQCPGEGSYTTAPLSFGQCPLPCPAQKVCIAGDSAPGRGHTHQRPLALGCARCLVRPKRSALLGKVPRGFSSIFRLLPGQGGRAVPAPLSGQSFCAAHSTMPRGSSPAFSSYPWPDLLATQPTHLPQQARRGIGPGGPSSIITPET